MKKHIFLVMSVLMALTLTQCNKDDEQSGKDNKHIAVTDVTLSRNEVFLDPTDNTEKNILITATIAPENTTNKKLTWKSSNPQVATVDGNGLVTAIKEGKAEIIVTTDDGKKTATCVVIVKTEKYEIVNINTKMEFLGKSNKIR